MSALDWSAAKEDWERLLAEQGLDQKIKSRSCLKCGES